MWYLDYKNRKCRKRLVNKLVEECIENIDEVKVSKITLAENQNSYKCNFTNVKCTFFNILYNKCWDWCLFCLL